MKTITRITIFILLFIIVGCSLVKNSKYRAVQTKEIYQSEKLLNINNVKSFGDYYAILIYVDRYTNLNRLETPRLDVEALSEVLTTRYTFKETRIVDNPKNSDELIAILDEFTKKLKKEDNLLIYYAGHGSYSKETDIGFWQLKDAKIDSRVGWISLNQAINYTLNLMPARHVLVLSDSCYSGALVRDSGIKMEKQPNPEDEEYYSKLYKIKSRNALTSGTLQPVMDNDPTNPNHSVFANGLLFMLKQNSKSVFTLGEKYPEIKRYVQLQTEEQIPIYKDIKKTGHEMGGDFIFIDRKNLKRESRERESTYKNLESKGVSTELPILKEIKKISNRVIIDDFENTDSSVKIREQAKERGIKSKNRDKRLPLNEKSFIIEEQFQKGPFKEDFSFIKKVDSIF